MAMGTKYFGNVFSNDIVFKFIVDNTILNLEKPFFRPDFVLSVNLPYRQNRGEIRVEATQDFCLHGKADSEPKSCC